MIFNFDRVAETYDATRGFTPEVTERIATWVLSRLPKDPAVAEIGVGTGRIAIPFIERGVRYSGFDISEQMVARLREKLDGDLRQSQVFIADVTEPLPLPPASQDAVISVHILHLVDAIKALKQVRKVLKPHGAVVSGRAHADRLAPREWIWAKFNESVAALGAGGAHDHDQQAIRDQLAQWGARATRYTVAVWHAKESPRQALVPLQERAMSSTWGIPDDVLEKALRRTEALARTEYGDLDRPMNYESKFDVDWYQF